MNSYKKQVVIHDFKLLYFQFTHCLKLKYQEVSNRWSKAFYRATGNETYPTPTSLFTGYIKLIKQVKLCSLTLFPVDTKLEELLFVFSELSSSGLLPETNLLGVCQKLVRFQNLSSKVHERSLNFIFMGERVKNTFQLCSYYKGAPPMHLCRGNVLLH